MSSCGGGATLEQELQKRCPADFANLRRIWEDQALKPVKDDCKRRKKLDYFLSCKETSPQAASFEVHTEEKECHLFEFLCKLVLIAPEHWYKAATGNDCPEGMKNDWPNIGVAFDASSRLRRAGIDYYHGKLTEWMAAKHPLEGWPQTPHVFYVNDKKAMPFEGLPPKEPGEARIVAISDTHLFHDRLILPPNGDFLVHAGDLCYEESRSPDAQAYDQYVAKGGSLKCPAFNQWMVKEGLDLAKCLDWLKSQRGFEHKVLIGGNHDYILGKMDQEDAVQLCKAYGVTYLHTDRHPVHLTLNSGLSARFWGSGLSFNAKKSETRAVASGNLSFQVGEEEGKQLLKNILRDKGGVLQELDVMVVHAPPTGKTGSAGEELGNFVREVGPKLFVCGHAHRPDNPEKDACLDLGKTDTVATNAACLGTWNHFHGMPVVSDVSLFAHSAPWMCSGRMCNIL